MSEEPKVPCPYCGEPVPLYHMHEAPDHGFMPVRQEDLETLKESGVKFVRIFDQ